MKIILFPAVRRPVHAVTILVAALLCAGVSAARAGLTFTLDIYAQSQGQGYVFYTPLVTNSIAPAAPLGSYFISSPQWPTNGSTRGFQLTASGLSDINGADTEFGYPNMGSILQQITNGNWTILFTNATTTNHYTFTVSAVSVPANLVPATIVTFPADGSVILPNQTSFIWQGPTNWSVNGNVETYDYNGYFKSVSLPASQMNWIVDTTLPVQTNYTFYLHYVTNCVVPVFVASTPLTTNTHQAISSGWASSNIFETGSSVSYAVVPAYGTPYQGHTCLAHYTFEDNNLFVHDFSGNGNDMSYAWFSVPPTIVTNDAVAGMYSGGWGGSGWFTPPERLGNLFAGSFSVSLWLQTTNVHGDNNDNLYSAVGIVSDLGGDYGESAMPMGQTGSKLAIYTGGSMQNILHSRTNINTGQYVHVVTTRDQQTGEKRIYVNGVLDASVHAVTDLLTSSINGDMTIGYNNANVFAGVMDEIEFYSGVLSSNDVAFLHSHPGTNVADTLELNVPVARYDFEQTNAPGTDSSGHNNNTDCTSGNGGTNLDTYSTNSAIGGYARQFFGDTSICFYPGASYYNNLSNALRGSFTVTGWVNTTNIVNADFANAYFGNPILFGYSDGTNQEVFSITGSKAAFTVGNPNGGSDTILHSTTSVNDGSYHFLAATRDQLSGLMRLYVDGHLEATGISTNGLRILNSTLYMAGGYFANYTGLLDDVRIYSGALASNDVALLYGNSPFSVGGALNAPQLEWTANGGDTSWFIESTNTHDGIAMQSGIVTNSQTSVLSTTVTGPGTLTFYWASQINGNFDYEFDIDGSYADDLYNNNDWYLEVDPNTGQPYAIPSGPHTLTWKVKAYGDNDPSEAGYLDQVSFVPSSPISLTSPQTIGASFQFAFQSQPGFTYNIEYSTNLVSGHWQIWSNFTGDGTLKQYPVPFSIFNPAKQGYMRVSTP
jgi:hypothetical protein